MPLLSLGSGGKCNFNFSKIHGSTKYVPYSYFAQPILHKIHLYRAVPKRNKVPITHKPVHVDAVRNRLCHFFRDLYDKTDKTELKS